MITNASDAGATNTSGWDLRGKASDPNPSYECPNGTSLFEFDSRKVFFYDAATGKWLGENGEER